jgi:signal transduction histidine kinase
VEAVVFFMRHPLLPDTQSELTIPIKIDGKVLGVLDIQEKPPRQFSQRQMNLMAAVADQLAVALQKATLYQELQTSLRQEKATRAQLIQSERLALVGRLLASVSHELNNPLQAIQNALFLIKGDEELSAQGRQDLDIILSETERMASLIGRLRTTYRATQVEDFQHVWLNDIIEDVHALTSTYMRHRKIVFTFHPAPDLPQVPIIPDRIRQVILNLFMNAIEAMPSGGGLTIQTYNLPEQERVLLTFSDTGPGINPEIQSHIFEPFVTDKDTGTGLGLTITADIIHQHQGEIHAENDAAAGATFKVWLPTRRSG